jgi:ATP-binding cassette subfamily F protein uup
VTKLVGLDQWEAWHRTQTAPRARGASAARHADAATKPQARKKLSFKEQRDFDTIESRIAAAEEKLKSLEAECALPEVVSDAERLVVLAREMASTRAEVDRLYARWAELETLR